MGPRPRRSCARALCGPATDNHRDRDKTTDSEPTALDPMAPDKEKDAARPGPPLLRPHPAAPQRARAVIASALGPAERGLSRAVACCLVA